MTSQQDLPCIGMIVPPAHGSVPPEPLALYADRARFVARGLALAELTASGYDGVIDRVVELSLELRAEGARAISLMGTSLSFYRGAGFTRELGRGISEATGLPATTMTDNVLEALNVFGARRLAVATAYAPEVNRLLTAYLEGEGYEVASLEALELTDLDLVQSTSTDRLVELGEAALSAATGPVDALFISCGGLKTLPVNPVLEARHALPVVSSAVAGAWGAMRCAGLDPSAENGGRLCAPASQASRQSSSPAAAPG
ncbi:MAG: arylmalonate decarboxylase [Rhodobacteraceae bacterium]|nr:arylmalonate decarboxylase [Paracoccaceae bacterium]